jgi:enamine deaminase RidA (YjgF/YER057c/UK114 family)
MVKAEPVNPKSLGTPIGYANGMRVGNLVFIAGQIGATPDADGGLRLVSEELVPQFERALSNVLAVLKEAGGEARDLVDVTIYVLDAGAYRRAGKEVGAAWRRLVGRHFPAMAVVGISSLYEPGALVEIKAVAARGED